MRLETERLILREWTPEDLPLIAAINRNVHVSEFFPTPLTDQQSYDAVRRYQSAHQRDGFGMLAAELKQAREFIGIIGMQTVTTEVPDLPRPMVEIGWRLAHEHWGTGLATEGARAVLKHAFCSVRLPRVIAITSASNVRSRRVMEKIGMTHWAELDFNHPLAAGKQALQKHVVYRLEAINFLETSDL